LNRYFKLWAISLVCIFLITPLISKEQKSVDIAALIDEAKKAPLEKRFELIIKIKKTIANMNDENRAIAIAQVQAKREAFKNENNMSQEQVEAFKLKIHAYEANRSKDIAK
jgi:hypothetical protein